MHTLLIILAVAALVHLLVSLMVANYGESKGFGFGPLFLAALFLGFPTVLLAVAIGGTLRRAVVEQA
jgi:hypothetical protein